MTNEEVTKARLGQTNRFNLSGKLILNWPQAMGRSHFSAVLLYLSIDIISQFVTVPFRDDALITFQKLYLYFVNLKICQPSVKILRT